MLFGGRWRTRRRPDSFYSKLFAKPAVQDHADDSSCDRVTGQLIGHLLLSPGKVRCLNPSHLRGYSQLHCLKIQQRSKSAPNTTCLFSLQPSCGLAFWLPHSLQCREIPALASAMQEVMVKRAAFIYRQYFGSLCTASASAAQTSLQYHHWPSDAQGLRVVLREFYVFLERNILYLNLSIKGIYCFSCDTWGQQPARSTSAVCTVSLFRSESASAPQPVPSLLPQKCGGSSRSQCVNHKMMQLVDIQYLLLCLVLFSWFWNLIL